MKQTLNQQQVDELLKEIQTERKMSEAAMKLLEHLDGMGQLHLVDESLAQAYLAQKTEKQ